MKPFGQGFAAVAGLSLFALMATGSAVAQKSGGVMKILHFDSPASMSIHEESTRATLQPMMAVLNNLVMYDHNVKQNRLDTIVSDLATSWSWSEDGKELTFKLREGVKWHDGKPFTAADVKCTMDLLMGTGQDKLRVNPRRSWYQNVEAVKSNGNFEITFQLKQPQPALLGLLASGWSPIYPCHVPARDMRQHPIGTGPFKFVEFKPNESIKVTKNPDYWKPGRPYLDGIEFTILREIAPRNLAFFAGNYDFNSPYSVTPPMLADFRAQAPNAICERTSVNVPRTMLINVQKAPFDNPELRKAMTLAVDRDAFSTIINGGEKNVGALMLPPPDGVWGMPEDMLQTLPGYNPDVEKNRTEAREIMKKLGYGPNNPLRAKITTRNIPSWRNPAVLLNAQLKEVWIETEIDIVDTAQWYPKISRKDFEIGAVPIESGVDDPDQMFYENFYTGAMRNYSGLSDPEIDRLIDKQSMETDPEKRKQIVWEIERKLAETAVRPVLFFPVGNSCWQPWVKNLNIMANSIYNGWRMEDVWLDRN
jgi:peptide/nickel transport system substrate-binding protein